MIKLTSTQKALAVNPHTGPSYAADEDDCAGCHRIHTAQGDYLIYNETESLRCLTCHDGSGSSGLPTAKEQVYRPFSHKLSGVREGSTMDCANCHESHRYVSGGYQLVNPTSTTQSWDIIDDVDDPDYDSGTSPSGVYRWCERCHVSSTQSGVLLPRGSSPYIPYQVEIDWKTSRSPTSSFPGPGVPESGSYNGYWEYFSANHYNTTGSSGEWHGSGNSSSVSVTAPYTSSYPAMACNDCHSHHGSSQPWAIKDSISLSYSVATGYDMTTGGYGGQYGFCISCHTSWTDLCEDYYTGPGLCTNCHRHGKNF